MKEIKKIRADIGTKMMIGKINEIKSWYFENINKIEKSSARLTKRKKTEDSKKIRNESRDITIFNKQI